MSVWQFVQDQVLGMRWLNTLINQLLTAVGLDTQSRIGGSVQFFLYDVLKITVLLCLLIFLISYVQSYFPPERSKKIMGRFHGLWANCVAALLGTVTESSSDWVSKLTYFKKRSTTVIRSVPFCGVHRFFPTCRKCLLTALSGKDKLGAYLRLPCMQRLA